MEKTSLITLRRQVPYTLFTRWLVIALLLCFFGQTVGAGPHLSLTADEPVYMAQGYVYWTRGDLRLQHAQAQPPLVNILSGVFLSLQPGPQPEALPGWADADLSQFTRAYASWYGAALPAATFAARLPIALVIILGIACAFRWAREQFGIAGGLLTLTLLAFDPNLIAHSGLAATDMLLATWSLIAIYAATRWLAQLHNWRWGMLSGIALGLTLGSKTSGFFAFGIVGILLATSALVELWERRRQSAMWVKISTFWIGKLGLVSTFAVLALWGLYRFELRPLPGTTVPVPFPTHWMIWQKLAHHMTAGHTAYLSGEISQTGWWNYYPLAFILKTPLPTSIILAGASIALLFALHTADGRMRFRQQYALWLTPLLYSVAAIISRIDIGYRYLLIMLPFLYGLCGNILVWINRRRWRKLTLLCGLSYLVIETLCICPHYLAYFNVLAGGAEGGYRYLVDSNLDWGQEFVALRKWLDVHPGDDLLYLSYYTYVDPTLYDIPYIPIAPAHGAESILPQRFAPQPGLYAISATPLHGVMTSPDNYAWFRLRQPLARPGYGIFLYQVPAQAPTPTWLGQCTVPAPPLTPDAIYTGLGRDDVRILTFDCTQAWVYPAGGAESGWYALHREAIDTPNDFLLLRLSATRLSYEQRQPGTLPAFALYEQAPLTPQPDQRVDPTPQIATLRFLGHTLSPGVQVRAGQDLGIDTYWQVLSPAPEPLSLMLHLVGADGTTVVVGDGLGFPVEQWQPDDLLIQRHRLALPVTMPTGTYVLHTGIYPLSTVQPLPVLVAGVPQGSHIELGAIEIVP